MLWRIAARLVTGPLAFLIAGVIDFAAFGIAAARQRRAARIAARRVPGRTSLSTAAAAGDRGARAGA